MAPPLALQRFVTQLGVPAPPVLGVACQAGQKGAEVVLGIRLNHLVLDLVSDVAGQGESTTAITALSPVKPPCGTLS